MNTYKQELDQIENQNLFRDLQQKIQAGEDIHLEDYLTQLSIEQRDVLRALIEGVNIQKQNAINTQHSESIPEII